MPKKKKGLNGQSGIVNRKPCLPLQKFQAKKAERKSDDEIQTRLYLSLADTAFFGESKPSQPAVYDERSKNRK